jgi:hypothetical protein
MPRLCSICSHTERHRNVTKRYNVTVSDGKLAVFEVGGTPHRLAVTKNN